MESKGSQVSLGPWSGANLQATAIANVGIGADSDTDNNEVRFRRGVARVILRRLASNDADSDPDAPALFLLSAKPPKCDLSLKRVPMLDNGRTQITGRIWLVNLIATMGYYHEYEFSDSDNLVTLVTERLGLQNNAAAIYDPRFPGEIHFYPKGLANMASCCEVVSIVRREIGLDEILNVVSSIHRKNLAAPSGQMSLRLWRNAAKRWPEEYPEKRIQTFLTIGLNQAFVNCTARPEQSMIEGRSDIEIEENDPANPGVVVRHAILELKVLTTFTPLGEPVSPNKLKAAVEKGVVQAASYRDAKGARGAALCCFDMQKTATNHALCFAHVLSLASKKAVELRLWFIYSRAEQYRRFLAKL